MIITAGSVSTKDTGPHPTQSDLDYAVAILAEDLGERDVPHPYLVGYLDVIIERLVELHVRCRKTDCQTCWNLRRASAILAVPRR